MNRLIVLLLAGFSSAFMVSCNQAAKRTGDQQNKDSATAASANTVVLKDQQINVAYKDYTSLKDALVASNAAEAQTAALSLSNSLRNIQGCQNTAGIASRIAGSSELDQQRLNFTLLSADFIPLMKHAEVQEGSLYVQFCPMANSRKGGYWIASAKEIRNPYYGENMLHCGEVRDSITSKSAEPNNQTSL